MFQLSEKTPDKPGRNLLKLKMINFNMVMMLDKILVNISKSCDKDAHYTTPVLYKHGKPGFDVTLASKINMTVKERFSVRCALFEGGRKFYDGTGQKTVPNKRTCLLDYVRFIFAETCCNIQMFTLDNLCFPVSQKINLEDETRQISWILCLFRRDSRSKHAAIVVVFVPRYYSVKRKIKILVLL